LRSGFDEGFRAFIYGGSGGVNIINDNDIFTGNIFFVADFKRSLDILFSFCFVVVYTTV